MKSKIKNEELIFFCKIFSFITEHFGITAKQLCDSTNVAFSEASVSSWRTRNPPGSDEIFNELLKAIRKCLEDKNACDYYDKYDYIENIIREITHYCKTPEFLFNNQEYSLLDVVLKTLEFAYAHKSLEPNTSIQEEIAVSNGVVRSKARTEAVVFDFDGTLTTTNKVKTTWESIWTLLGYDVQECRNLHMKFSHNEITHKEWCSLTEEKFKAKKLHRNQLLPLIQETQLIAGIEEVFQKLDQRDIKIYIVSGSIKHLILKCLGGLNQYISGGINANIFDFDENGYLFKIIGTEYDFEGKANRIIQIAKELSIDVNQILFVGNSFNDEWAHSSGARTLAINPKNTHMYNPNVWDDCIVECNSLTEILKFI